MIARSPFAGIRLVSMYKPVGTLGVAFQYTLGTLCLGHVNAANAMTAVPIVSRLRISNMRGFWSGQPSGPFFRPREKIAVAIDNAAAMTSKLRTASFPSVIVECALSYSQFGGCFGSNEKIVIGLTKHGLLHLMEQHCSLVWNAWGGSDCTSLEFEPQFIPAERDILQR